MKPATIPVASAAVPSRQHAKLCISRGPHSNPVPKTRVTLWLRTGDEYAALEKARETYSGLIGRDVSNSVIIRRAVGLLAHRLEVLDRLNKHEVDAEVRTLVEHV